MSGTGEKLLSLWKLDPINNVSNEEIIIKSNEFDKTIIKLEIHSNGKFIFILDENYTLSL